MQELLKTDARVVATARDPKTMNDLREIGGDRILALLLRD